MLPRSAYSTHPAQLTTYATVKSFQSFLSRNYLVCRNTLGLYRLRTSYSVSRNKCLRLIEENDENAEILCVIVYCIGMCLRQNSGHGV